MTAETEMGREHLCPWCGAYAPTYCELEQETGADEHGLFNNWWASDQADGGFTLATKNAAFAAWLARSALLPAPTRDDVLEALRTALEAAEYEPGDYPIVPVKIADFMTVCRAILSARALKGAKP